MRHTIMLLTAAAIMAVMLVGSAASAMAEAAFSPYRFDTSEWYRSYPAWCDDPAARQYDALGECR